MIKKTTDYDMFQKSSRNREIDSNNLSRLIRSLQDHNLLEKNPIKVNSDLVVIDGQHRLEACKALGVPVYYEIGDWSIPDMLTLNMAQKAWTQADFISYHANSEPKNQNYVRILKLCDASNESVNGVIKVVLGYNHRLATDLRNGSLRFSEQNLSDAIIKMRDVKTVCDYLADLEVGNGCHLQLKFKQSLYGFLSFPGVTLDQLMKNLEVKGSWMRKQSMVMDYTRLLQRIYNHRCRNPIDIEFEE